MEEHDEVERILIDAEADGLTVVWSDCERCGQPRSVHGPGLICPT